uniref:uncharacterized protein LOC118145832 n=1 Tax=Callithrix jacchus TaxID=9483 RepID=UPI0023DD1A08|nr:uncharacterized protein LOC118145832 [Callithrix jacchus]
MSVCFMILPRISTGKCPKLSEWGGKGRFRKVRKSSGSHRREKARNEIHKPPPSSPESLLCLSQSDVSIAGRPTNQELEQEPPVSGRGFQEEGGRNRSAPPCPRPLHSPPQTTPRSPRPRPRPRPTATSLARLEPRGQRPAAGPCCPEGQKKGGAGGGDSHVASGGFTTFSFAIDGTVKCVREAAAQPGLEREGAGQVSRPGDFAADGTGGRPWAPATRSGSAGSRPGRHSERSREPRVVQARPSSRSISGDPGLPRRCRPVQAVPPRRLRIRGWSRRIPKAEVGRPGYLSLLSLWRRRPMTEAPSSNPEAAFSPYRKSDGLMTSWLAAERRSGCHSEIRHIGWILKSVSLQL